MEEYLELVTGHLGPSLSYFSTLFCVGVFSLFSFNSANTASRHRLTFIFLSLIFFRLFSLVFFLQVSFQCVPITIFRKLLCLSVSKSIYPLFSLFLKSITISFIPFLVFVCSTSSFAAI